MANSTQIVALCLLVIIFSPQTSSLKAYDIQLERTEQVGGEGFADWQVRVRKFNRTTFSLNGTATLLQDLDESYEVSINYAYSSLGNNQFNEYPMKTPRKKVCQFMIEEYRESQHIWTNYTNMPQIDKAAQVFCPFPKGTYWVRDIAPELDWVPPVVPTGLWRMTVSIWRDENELVSQIVFYIKLTRKFNK